MYCPQTTFAERFSQAELDQLTDATTGMGLDYARAAADADALVDSYLGAVPGRTFALPVDPVPAVLAGIAADLVRFNLWAARASEEVRNRRDQAVAWLKDVVAGKAALPLAADPAPTVGLGMTARSADRVFSADTLRDFVGGCP